MKANIKYFNHAVVCVVFLLMHPNTSAKDTNGFRHDFVSKSWDTTDKICVICHAPHNTTLSWPLWDYSITKSAYTLYVIRAEYAERNRPEGTSKLCLSCHDGTVGVDAYGGTDGSPVQATDASGNTKEYITIRSPDHPISILYSGETANVGLLKNPIITTVQLANSEVPVTVTAGMLSPAHKVECATCHDVHKTALSDEEEDNYGLLIMKTADGQLCLSCHQK